MKNTRYLLWSLLGSMAMTGSAHAAFFPSLDSDANFNAGFGSNTLFNLTNGIQNTASGHSALFSNTTGDNNTASGAWALFSNTTGYYNIAIGAFALSENTTGYSNTASGAGALGANTTGKENTASGDAALYNNTTGKENTASGAGALFSNTTGYNNTASGFSALVGNRTGVNNTASGHSALFSNTTGLRNTGIGVNALKANTIGSDNIALGTNAGNLLTTGVNNIDIGNVGVAGETRTIRIGRQSTQLKTFIAGIRGATVAGGAVVVVSSTGQLGITTSSRRYKEDIHQMGEASAALLKLKPVTFRYKEADEQGNKPVQFGLIAEDVAEVLPELVVYDDKGKPETVAYRALSSLLLNEFQKEHERFKKEHDKLVAVEAQAKAQAAELALVKGKADAAIQELALVHADMAQLKQVTQQLLAARPSSASVAQVEP